VRPKDQLARRLDAVGESVPAGVQRVECDELHPAAQRPSGNKRAREGRLARAAAAVDQDDGIGRGHGHDRLEDVSGGDVECRGDRVRVIA
jgi:hypothetical protein